LAIFDLPLPELERYLPEVDEPADFDAFWEATLDEARGLDFSPQVTPVETGLSLVDVLDVTFAGFGGHPIKAWAIRPAGSSGRPLPAVVEYLGYGGGRGLPVERLAWAAAGGASTAGDSRANSTARRRPPAA
jgi:cephalosporin-C deacetylase